MSMDFVFYTTCEFALPNNLPRASSWSCYDSSCDYDGDSWLIRARTYKAIDVPPDVMKLLPGIKYATALIVEGPSQVDDDFLESIMISIAERCGVHVLESGIGIHLLGADG